MMAGGRWSRWVLLFTAAVSLAAAAVGASAAGKSHIVGGTVGWTIPPDGSKTYSAWAASQTFALGDILVFDFINGVHDVTQVSKTDFETCNIDKPIAVTTESPAKLTLNATGEFYYICGFPAHCDAGQKVSVKVAAAGKPRSHLPPAPSSAKPAVPIPSTHHRHGHGASSPVKSPARSPAKPPARSPAKHPVAKSPARSPAKSPAAKSPARLPAKTPARSPAEFTVGDQLGWMIPPSVTTYQDWANGKSFMVGDVLVFNYRKGSHDVAEVTKESFDTCTTTTAAPPPSEWAAGPPIKINLTAAGPHFFLCTVYGHCPLGQRLAITVAATTGAIPPALPPIYAYGRDTAAATAPVPEKSAGRPTTVAARWFVPVCAGYVLGLLMGFM